MKKYISIALLAVASVTMTSCYDLDRNPFDQPSSATFWKTAEQCKQGVMGVYSTLKLDGTYGGLFKNEINSDVAMGYDQNVSLINGTASATPTNLEKWVLSKWRDSYDGIHLANTAIRNITAANIDDEIKQQMLGEMRFLRGLYYFDLTKYYGGVPIYDESVVIDQSYSDLNRVRSSVEEVRNFALTDLEFAAENLPISWSAAEYGRVTKSAAYAIMGKVYLFNKDYANAIENFEEVLKPEYGHELYPDYANLFKPGGDESSEMIFAVQNLGGVGNELGMPMAWYLGNRSTYGAGWSNIFPSTRFVDGYENIDGTKFNWNDYFPGYNESADVKKEIQCCTFSEDLKSVIAEPEHAEEIIAAYSTDRDPRLAATVITPLSGIDGWVGNKDRYMRMMYGYKQGVTDKIAVVVAANGFMMNNRTSWRSYLYRKFVPESNMDGEITHKAHTPINFPVIRLADVYLMLAEAYNEQGDQTIAVEFINKVRRRVDMPDINNGDAWMEARSKEEVFDRIFHERGVELAVEGLREVDLRRWKLSEVYLPEFDEYDVLGDLMFTRKFNPERDYLWPIPNVEIEISTLIEQNPGW